MKWILGAVVAPMVGAAIGIVVENEMTSEAKLWAKIERTTEPNDRYRFSLVVKNVGNASLQKEQAYIRVRFRKPILEMTEKKDLPSGTSFPEDTCKGRTDCRINLGYLKPGGTIPLEFYSQDALSIFPVVNHGGREIGNWWCCGLEDKLADACSG